MCIAEMAKTSQHVAVAGIQESFAGLRRLSCSEGVSRAHCLHCGKQPHGRDLGQFKQLVSTARHRADHRIWTFVLCWKYPNRSMRLLEGFVKIILCRERAPRSSRSGNCGVLWWGRRGGDADGRVASAESARMPRQNCGARTCVVTRSHLRQRRTTSVEGIGVGFRPATS